MLEQRLGGQGQSWVRKQLMVFRPWDPVLRNLDYPGGTGKPLRFCHILYFDYKNITSLLNTEVSIFGFLHPSLIFTQRCQFIEMTHHPLDL